MAPSLPGGARSPTSKNSQGVISQRLPGLQETNKQSTRFFGGSLTTIDTSTEDNDDGDADGGHLLTTSAGFGAKRVLHTNSSFFFF